MTLETLNYAASLHTKRAALVAQLHYAVAAFLNDPRLGERAQSAARDAAKRCIECQIAEIDQKIAEL